MSAPSSIMHTHADAMATAANGVSTAEGPEAYLRMIEMWFTFCVIWSIGGALDAAFDAEQAQGSCVDKLEGAVLFDETGPYHVMIGDELMTITGAPPIRLAMITVF